MALARAQHDQIALHGPCHTHDFGLDAADFHPLMAGIDADIGAQRRQALARRGRELIQQLHRRHHGLAHRFDRHEFDDMQHRELGAHELGEFASPPANADAVGIEVNGKQDSAVDGHGGIP